MRTVFSTVFAYTAKLRLATNPATDEQWTEKERTVKAVELYPQAALSLAAGYLEDDALKEISHAATKSLDTDFSWQPPKEGFIKVGGVAWEILESWVPEQVKH